jgi:hypothetical protein
MVKALKPESAEVTIAYSPRAQFVPFHSRTARFACIVTHRRAGKTVACIHDLHRAAITCERTRPRFAYMSPFLKQAKSVAWDYLRAAVAAGRQAGASVHESELRVDYPSGAQVRLFGADNADALRGLYLDGIVLDEHADMDPRVWPEVIRPALADRRGWAVFIGTPKGRNGFFEMWRRAQSDPAWFALMLKASETGLISAQELDARSLRRAIRTGIRMLLRCSGDRRLLRQARTAGEGADAHHQRAARAKSAGLDGMGLRRSGCNSHLVCAGCGAGDSHYRLLRKLGR